MVMKKLIKLSVLFVSLVILFGLEKIHPLELSVSPKVPFLENSKIKIETFVLQPLHPLTSCDTTLVAIADAPIFLRPDAQSPKLGVISSGSKIHILAKTLDQEWSLAENGYLKSDCLRSEYVKKTNTAPIESSNNLQGLCDEKWQQLPQKVHEEFTKRAVTIQICGKNLAKELGKSYSILGMTEYGSSPKIYLQGCREAINLAYLHECGHAYDNCLNFVSDDQEWYEIYQEERMAFQGINLDETGDQHDVSSPSEYFAAVFSNYIKQNANLKKTCPKSYEFLHSNL